MIEAEIRKRAIEILEGEGYVTWFPYTNRFAAEKDIFGFADIIAGRGSKLKLIQITEYSHTSHRVKKVKETMARKRLTLKDVEVWAWHNGHKRFMITKI